MAAKTSDARKKAVGWPSIPSRSVSVYQSGRASPGAAFACMNRCTWPRRFVKVPSSSAKFVAGNATATREASAAGSVVPMTMIVPDDEHIVASEPRDSRRPREDQLLCSADVRGTVSTQREVGHALERRLRSLCDAED